MTPRSPAVERCLERARIAPTPEMIGVRRRTSYALIFRHGCEPELVEVVDGDAGDERIAALVRLCVDAGVPERRVKDALEA
jgi:hypothetical protein